MSSFVAIAAFAASAIVPAQPLSFEQVILRIPVDSCAFAPSTVRVTLASNTFRVTQQVNNCFAPGTPQVADVRLGAVPAGDYRVELYGSPSSMVPPIEMLSFQVRDPVEVVPRTPRPLTDYSGLWFNPSESGWGLSLHQGPTHAVFGLLFVYDGARQPQWYSLQGGHWTSYTKWTANAFRTTGPGIASPVFDPALVQYAPSGTVTIEFAQSPGEEGRARVAYTIDNVTATKVVQRLAP
jgi:hypothetical protein